MHYSIVLLGIASAVVPSLADRGSATNIVPTICNSEPTQTTTPTPAPTCYHAADPDGGMGLCPNLSDEGWCDCGSDGDYPILTGSDICGYTSLPASTLALTSTSCQSSTTTLVSTVTVVPVPVTVSTSSGAVKRGEPTFVPVRRGVSRPAGQLKKRGGTVTYADSCNAAVPANSGYKPADGFNTMADVLRAAYADAQALAGQAQGVANDNVGFTHYFGGALADVQLQHFQRMMQGVASGDINYNIQFECANTPDCPADVTRQSAMVTDATAGNSQQQKIIQVCSSFWTSASTRFLLFDPNHNTNSVPWRTNDASGWCGKRTVNGDSNVSARNNQFFATPGHTVLHELTHLDALATYAGLTADLSFRHGTLDVQGTCELQGARQFLIDYNAGNTGGTSPDYNAESYAAAATEIWFMNLCGFSQISPVT